MRRLVWIATLPLRMIFDARGGFAMTDVRLMVARGRKRRRITSLPHADITPLGDLAYDVSDSNPYQLGVTETLEMEDPNAVERYRISLLVRDRGRISLWFRDQYVADGKALGTALFRNYGDRSQQEVREMLFKLREQDRRSPRRDES